MVSKEMKNLTIAVAGAGYVGMSIAVLLAQHNRVYVVDIAPEKVDMINLRKSPIADREMEAYLSKESLKLSATLDAEAAYSKADFIVAAAPTNYDPARNFFDTSAVEDMVRTAMKSNPEAFIVIKSTVPVGYTEGVRERMGNRNIFFCPEFLRGSKALYDNLYPSRIIIGADIKDEQIMEGAQTFVELLQEGAEKRH